MNTKKAIVFTVAAVIIIAAVVAIFYSAGALFFMNNGENPIGTVNALTWLEYYRYYSSDELVRTALMKSIAFPAVGIGAVAFTVIFTLLRPKPELHGSARFASKREVAAAGLFAEAGIIVGKFGKQLMMFPGMQFVLLLAPTRSGKGVGVVIPNCLAYQESMAILDVKGENFEITSKYREANGQQVFKFNPFGTDTHRYNMLGYISDDPNKRVAEILSLGYAIFPGEGRDSFFDDAARNLFLALTLYMLETPGMPRTMGELLRQSSGKGKPIKEYLDAIITDRNYVIAESISDEGEVITKKVIKTEFKDGEPPALSDECVDALNRFMGTSDNTLSSILASFNTPLTLWASPIVDAATSANDFDLRNIRKRRTTIYVVVPANKLSEAELILNVFFTQLVNLNTDKLLNATPEIKHPCLLLMDEFTAPGKIKVIDKSIAFLAGYGLRMVTIAQSLGQLEAEPKRGYGREGARTLVTNHALQIMYTPREQSDAEAYSKILGTFTYKSKSTTRTKLIQGSISDQSRALMMPQEFREMPQSKEVISLENTKPIICEKIRYYQEPVFVRRLQSVAPSLKTPFWRRFPTQKQLELAAGTGELSTQVPVQNVDLHRAKVQQRIRPVSEEDFTNGIDLDTLACGTTVFETRPGAKALGATEVANMVDNFFDSLDSSGEVETDLEQALALPPEIDPANALELTSGETEEVSINLDEVDSEPANQLPEQHENSAIEPAVDPEEHDAFPDELDSDSFDDFEQHAVDEVNDEFYDSIEPPEDLSEDTNTPPEKKVFDLSVLESQR